MGNAGSGAQPPEGMSAINIRSVQFPYSKGFGRGYDPRLVDEVIARCAVTVEMLTARLAVTRGELIRVRKELDELRSQPGADHAVELLKTAQATADAIVTKAMEEQERAAEETRVRTEQARREAASRDLENERRARQVAEEAARRAALLQEQAGERLHRLTVATELAEQEIDREARQLQTFRDATRAQIDEFIDGLLDHVAEQYGRAHPLAAQAAATARRSLMTVQSSGKPPAGGRGRRAPRVAGRSSVPTERWAEPAPDVSSATPSPLPASALNASVLNASALNASAPHAPAVTASGTIALPRQRA